MPITVEALVTTGAWELTVKVRVALPVPAALVAPMVTVKVPTVEGVPVIAPVDELTLKPGGRPVAL